MANTNNFLQKQSAEGVLSDSLVSDDGTNVSAKTPGGATTLGDPDAEGDGNYLKVDDSSWQVMANVKPGGNFSAAVGDAYLQLEESAFEVYQPGGDLKFGDRNNTHLRIQDAAETINLRADAGIAQSAPASAPADALLANGQLVFFAAEGSSKISFKYKDSGGVVRTGDVGTYS